MKRRWLVALVVSALAAFAAADPAPTVERWGVCDLTLEGPADGNGSRLIVDGEVVVDNDGEHAPTPKTGQIGLAKGLHEVRVEFFERAGGQALEVVWSSPTIDPQPVPAERLRHRAE